MTANVQDLTVPELYSLAWEVAERLVELEVARLTAATEPVEDPMPGLCAQHGNYYSGFPSCPTCNPEGEGAGVALAGSYVFCSSDDNYGAW